MNYLHWNVDHIIFHIYGPFSLRWYSLFFLTGFLLGLSIFKDMAQKEGKGVDYTDTLLFYTIMGTILGARLGHCLLYQPEYYLTHPIEILKIWEGGLASHGGFLGVIIAVAIFAKQQPSLPFLWMIDMISILALMTGGFIRLGNLFNSEIIGKITTVPWAFIFDKIDSYPRHPSQLYESIGYFSISIFIYFVYIRAKRKPLPGKLLGLTLCLGFTMRSFLEFFKENQVPFENTLVLNMGQLLSLPFIIVGLYLSFGCHRNYLKK